MSISDKWDTIKELFQTISQGSLHCAVATVDTDGNPHVSPIGSIILGDDCTGYYFEEFPVQLSKNLDESGRVALLAVNGEEKYWFESLSNGKFQSYPGIRLLGKSLGTRKATPAEIDAWHQRVQFAEGLKGHDILWKNMTTIRELKFDGYKPVFCGEMTAHLAD